MVDFSTLTDETLREVLDHMKEHGHLKERTVTEGGIFGIGGEERSDLYVPSNHARPAQIDLAVDGILPKGVNAFNIAQLVDVAEERLGDLSHTAPEDMGESRGNSR